MKTHKFMISYGIILRMRNILDKSCRKDQNTHFKFTNFFQKLCHLWDVGKCGRV